MKKQTNLKLIEAFAVLFLIVMSVGLFLWINFSSNIADVGFNNEQVKSLGGSFTVTCILDSGEETIETQLPSKLENAKAGDTVRMTWIINEEELNGRYLAFYRQQSWADIYLDDELLIEAERMEEVPFPLSAGSRWYIFRLPEDADGKELRIEMTAQFDEYAPNLPQIYSGSKSSIIYRILYDARFPISIGVATITLGVACVLLGFLYRKRVNGRIILLGLVAVAISMWYLLESRASQVLFGNIALFSFALFACYYLIPVLVTALLLTFETFNKHKYMHILFWISVGNFLVVQFLQILGIAYYIELVSLVHILLILIIAVIIACFVQEKRSGQPIEDLYIYKALLVLSGFSVVDIIGFYVYPDYMVGTASKVGLLIFIIYLIYTAFKQFYEIEIDIAKSEVYQELAIKDLMTGLANRTAFEQEMSRLRSMHSWTEKIYFLFADVNDMKGINDHYGHTSGDDCLINTAQILTKCFAKPSICYRIGGDEFCVICRGLTAEEIDARIEKLNNLVKEKDEETIYPYAVACGYHVIDGEGADECLKKADTIMYQVKARYKSQRGK